MRLSLVLLTAFSAAAMAENGTAPSTEAAPPPPMTAPAQMEVQPTPAEGGAQEVIEPQITIVQRGEDEIEEYRISGQLYMIKVSPAKGFPYFLIDNDGDGSMETRRNELSNPVVPQWVLFRW